MKKGIFLTLATALMLCFAACQKDDNPADNNGNNGNGSNGGNNYSQLVVGTWLVDNMTVDGEDRTPQNLLFTFNAGGTGLMNDNGETENNQFNWSVNGSSITITPRNGAHYVYNINTLTVTECAFSGTVVPGTDIEGSVTIHMVKHQGGGNPGGDTEAFPAGTRWQETISEYETYYDTLPGGDIDSSEVLVEVSFKLQFAASGLNGNLAMAFFMEGIPFIDFDLPFTYTYDADTQQGVLTLSVTDEDTGETETGTMDFHYDATQNVIIIDVPEEAMEGMEGMEQLVLTPVQ